MARRRFFDPTDVPLDFWRRDDVLSSLARRDVGMLFAQYLTVFPECTQTELARLTEHDRSDISNFVRGARSPRVSDIDVLNRIADGLNMPDEARVVLGLAPGDLLMSQRPGLNGPDPSRRRLAICGSRLASVPSEAIDQAIAALGRLVTNRDCLVDHGPMGIGIEVMTYIADHYRPPDLLAAVGIFGRQNVVRNADFVLVVGGGSGTLDEVDMAVFMGKPVLPFVGSGGAASVAYGRMKADDSLRVCIAADDFDELGGCTAANDYVKVVERIIFL